MAIAFNPLDIVLFTSLGLSAGVLAGLLGIGGGMVIVPGLFHIFIHLHLPDDSLMHMAAGTSMGIMVATSTASTLAHHARGNIQWSMFRRVLGGIGVGVLTGYLMSSHLNSHLLELLFGLLLAIVALKILTGWKPDQQGETQPDSWLSNGVGWAIGLKSGIFGVGGGALSVPFLLYCGLPVNKVSGTSASFTLPIAILGSLAFLFLSPHYATVPWSTGYVYWPALLAVAPFTMIGARMGARLTTRVPTATLRLVFALLLVFLSLKMLGVFGAVLSVFRGT